MRWSGKLGFTTEVEVSKGRFEDVVTERPAMGEIETRTDTFTVGDQVLTRAGTSTSVSVLFGSVERIDFSSLVYITHRGKRYVPSSIVEDIPRIVIYLGEEYNGPKPADES